MLKLDIDSAGDIFTSYHYTTEEAMNYVKDFELESHYPILYTITESFDDEPTRTCYTTA